MIKFRTTKFNLNMYLKINYSQNLNKRQMRSTSLFRNIEIKRIDIL